MSEYHGHMTMSDGSHKALTADEAEALWRAIERDAEDRARLMPTSDDAMRAILDAQQRMKALGWRKGLGIVGVKRGDECAVREDGSTGIWSGWVDQDGKYVNYCDCVSDPRKVWLKPLTDLTDDERAKMAECDKDDREFHNRMIQSLIAADDIESGEQSDGHS
jgi:hypothetical protein